MNQADIMNEAAAKCFSPSSCILYLYPTYKYISSSSYNMPRRVLGMIFGFWQVVGEASGGSSTTHTVHIYKYTRTRWLFIARDRDLLGMMWNVSTQHITISFLFYYHSLPITVCPKIVWWCCMYVMNVLCCEGTPGIPSLFMYNPFVILYMDISSTVAKIAYR